MGSGITIRRSVVKSLGQIQRFTSPIGKDEQVRFEEVSIHCLPYVLQLADVSFITQAHTLVFQVPLW